MPAGACVIKYEGKRGIVWRIKYTDASGVQQKETLGPAVKGWTRKKAQSELRARLTQVEREGYRKPTSMKFGEFADEWVHEYPDRRGLKKSTRLGYEQIVANHLVPAFGHLRLTEIGVERIEQHVTSKMRAGLEAATCNRQLNVLSLIFRAALRRRLVASNPVALVDRPRETRRKWRIFLPAEVALVAKALDELVDEASSDTERDDRRVARAFFLVLLGTGLRRGEALGLRWKAVMLADPDGAKLRVEETWVRHADDTPKSQAGQRTIALGGHVATALFEHRAWSAFSGDEERVFANPRTGRPFDPNRWKQTFDLALARASIEGYVRPCHDLRHSSITNAAAAGTKPEPLMARAGHSSYSTTRRYIDLAGETFREEADLLERRLWGSTGTKKRYQDEGEAAEVPAAEGPTPLG